MLPPAIICEGVEDEAFLRALLRSRGIPNCYFHWESKSFQPPTGKPLGGISNFGQILLGLAAEREIKERPFVMIVADNDGNPGESFKSVQAQIKKAGYAVPNTPREPIAQETIPPIIVLMIPWDDDHGCLETLCLSAAEKKYPHVLACVDSLIKCVNPIGWETAKIAKLRMRCYLSSICKSDPNTGLRFAWTSDRMPQEPIPIDDEGFGQIAEYLRSLIVKGA